MEEGEVVRILTPCDFDTKWTFVESQGRYGYVPYKFVSVLNTQSVGG